MRTCSDRFGTLSHLPYGSFPQRSFSDPACHYHDHAGHKAPCESDPVCVLHLGVVVWTPSRFRSPSPVRCLKVSQGAGAAGGWQARPAWVKQRQQPSPGRLSAASQHMALWQPPRGYTKRLDRSTLRVTSRMERRCLQGPVGSSPRLSCRCTIGMRGWRKARTRATHFQVRWAFQVSDRALRTECSTLSLFLFDAPAIEPAYQDPIAEAGRKLRAATRDDRWKT